MLLPVQARSVATARRELRRTLDRWGMPELTFDATVVVSELTTNAVRHLGALGPVQDRRIGLTFRRLPGGVLVEVHDSSDVRPLLPERTPDGLPETGRGLRIVADLTAGDWGVWPRPAGPGKVVWGAVRRV
ncbi:ATP-binding protein [Streptomyces sp. KK5PA1]|uniref:ATP-binding protein n=2 Tax=Actinacidiphila acididurans TaxID=2784346 RepID=A0ABS2TNI6_9ACTN|nr:ATP-binding protein [Actinacidiphila acididurans]